MATAHVQLNGTLAPCPDANACPLPLHIPDMDEAAIASVPSEVLRELIASLDPTDNIGEDGLLRWYDRRGRKHRDYDLPALIETDPDFQVWFQHGKIHRDHDLPAYITDHTLRWYQHDKVHRGGDQPAVIEYDVSGSTHYQCWYHRDELHRAVGPAVIMHDSLGQTTKEYYWHGNRVTGLWLWWWRKRGRVLDR